MRLSPSSLTGIFFSATVLLAPVSAAAYHQCDTCGCNNQTWNSDYIQSSAGRYPTVQYQNGRTTTPRNRSAYRSTYYQNAYDTQWREPVTVTPAVFATIREYAFRPQTISIRTGTMVTWFNDDDTSHTLKGDNFDMTSLIVRPGSSTSFFFDRPGTFYYHDTFYTRMQGVVKVTN